MNISQKIVVVIASVILVAMLLFPPFKYSASFGFAGLSKGYAFIGMAPAGAHINWAVLYTQWGAVLFLAGVLYLVLSKKRNCR